MRKIRFSGFPPRLKDETALRNILGTLGKVVSVHVSTSDKGEVTGTCKFSDADEAAVTFAALNGFKIGDHTIKVEREDSDGDDGKRREEKKKKKDEEKSQLSKESKSKSTVASLSGASSSKVSSKSADGVTKPKVEKSSTVKREFGIDGEASKPKKPKLAEMKASGPVKEKQTETVPLKRLSSEASDAEKKRLSQAAEIKKPSSESSETEKKKKIASAELVRQSSDGVEKKKKLEQQGEVKRSSSATTKPDKAQKASDLGELRKASPEPSDGEKKLPKKKLGEEKIAKSVQAAMKEPMREKTEAVENAKKSPDVSEKEKRKSSSSVEQEKPQSAAAGVAKKPKEEVLKKDEILVAPAKKLKTEVPKQDSSEKPKAATVSVQKQVKTAEDPIKSKTEGSSEPFKNSSKVTLPGTSVPPGPKHEAKETEKSSTTLGKPDVKLERVSSGMSTAEEKAKQKEIAIAAAKSAMSMSTQQPSNPAKEEVSKNAAGKTSNEQAEGSSGVSKEPAVGSDRETTKATDSGETWEEYFDESYQVPYYYNPATDQTTWELPPPGSKIVKVVSADASAGGEPAAAIKDEATRDAETMPPTTETSTTSIEGKPTNIPLMQRESSIATADAIRSQAGSQATNETSAVPSVQRSSTSPAGASAASTADVPVQQSHREPVSAAPYERMPSTGSLGAATRPPFTLPEELEHRRGETISGVVTDLKNHYGFIRCQTTPTFSLKGDMFFHFDELVPAYIAPKLGDEVEFEIGFNVKRRRPIALAVRKLGMKRPSTSVSPVGSAPVASTALPSASIVGGISGAATAAPVATGAAHFPAPSPTSSVPSVPSARGGGGLASATSSGYQRRDNSSTSSMPGPAPRQRSRDRLPSREGAPRAAPRRRSRSPLGAVRRQHSSPGVLQSAGGGVASAPYGNRFSHTRDQSGAIPPRRKDLEWKMYVDRTSNQPYWYCAQTGETTWVNPHTHRQ